ncbi:MAG TPA: hypothetical protein VHD36_08485 [Pirellulales bacterium]|nr:hypothetical protein [Pirellulales bacterium]
MTRIGDETVNSFSHGRTSAIGTAAMALVATSVAATKGVQSRAADSNTATVYVGHANLTTDTSDATDGFPLKAGEALFVPVNDASKIFVASTAANQKIFWFAI